MHFNAFLLSLFLLIVYVFAAQNGPSFNLVIDAPEGGDPSKQRGSVITRLSSKLEFTENAWDKVLGADPRKLAQLAKDAFWQKNELENSASVKVRNRPTVMTAMAIGNEIYLSSSLIGTNSFTYKLRDTHPLRVALNKCEESLIEEWDRAGADTSNNRPGWSRHMRQAACGEQMALLMYFEKYSQDMEGARAALKDAHIITVRSETLSDAKERGSGVSGGTEKLDIRYDKIIRFDPCGTSNADEVLPSRFGCFQTVNQFGITFYREEADEDKSFDKDFQLKADQFKTEKIGISC